MGRLTMMRFVRRLPAQLLRLRRPSPRVGRLLSVVAAAVFAATVVWGVTGYQSAGLEVNWPLLVAAVLLGTPLAVALNAAELRAMARAVDAEIGRGAALRASLMASAANALPLPGSVLVRGWSLREAGVDLPRIVGVQALAGATFVAVAAATTGPLIALASPAPGLVVAGGGVVLLTVLALRRRGAVARLAAVETAMVASELARLSAVVAALGLEVTPARSAGLVLAGVAAAAVGVFPAGLGLRELLAAAVGPAIALPSALAVAVSVSDRIGTSTVLAVLVAGAVAFRGLPARLPVDPQPPMRRTP
ncbi:MAG: hypothetical protein AAF962_25440 [Actinomycetota bacterium]